MLGNIILDLFIFLDKIKHMNKTYKLIQAYLDKNPSLVGDAKLLTNYEWKNRGEKYCLTSQCTLIVDGSPLYDMVNCYGLHKEMAAFVNFLQKNGIYHELGYAWSIHFYYA
jgi:hypothetical protein